MDEQTIQAYTSTAETFATRYESASGGISSFFPLVFGPGMRVLDIGCGSGRDVQRLAELGCDAWGIEPSAGLLAEARRLHPDMAERLLPGSVPHGLDAIRKHAPFDGVVLSAVLMHVPDAEFAPSVEAVSELLSAGGRVLLSVPTKRSDVDADTERDEMGRLFVIRSVQHLAEIFMSYGMVPEQSYTSPDSLGRNIPWETIVFARKVQE